MVSLQQANDARIAALQSQLAARSAQLEQMQAQLAAAQRQVASREGEASRLAGLLGAGPDVDRLARDQLSAASDDIILSLNKQVRARQHGPPRMLAPYHATPCNSTAPWCCCAATACMQPDAACIRHISSVLRADALCA